MGRRMRIRKTCRICKVKFHPRVSTQFLCSRLCTAKWLSLTKTNPPHVCPVCGKKFHAWEPKQRFCSIECRGKGFVPWNKGKKLGPAWNSANIWLNCEWCGKPFRIPPCRKAKARFCSGSCRSRHTVRQQSWYKGGRDPHCYRLDAAKRFAGTCERCSEPIDDFQCHHIDGNNQNNPLDGSNWLLVCPRCHYEVHH